MPKHVTRLLALMGAALVLALIARWFLIPDSFYRFGHFRANSVTEIAAKEPVFQGAGYCATCHGERHAEWSANNHKSVACETCHGPAKGHPDNGKLPVPADTVAVCTLCHEAMPGRPRTQPQVVVAQHAANQQCKTCHNAHAPKIAAVAAKVEGDVAAGRKLADAECASCHGAKGISPNDTWPSLGGQNAAYLVRIMSAYKSGDQHDVIMTPLAQSLSDADIRNLAVYYAGMSCVDRSVAAPAGANVAAGKELAKNCAACHGETGVGTNPAWPNFAGQKPGYLVNVLKAFRGGLRKDPTMAGVVRGLSDADIANLAAYYATQSCQPTKK
jgi:cytochrome c553